MDGKTLVFVPTYNERDNALRMCVAINEIGLDADILFMDDNSPDGTGRLLEELKSRFPRLIVRHRTGKLGLGSAHLEAIQWAYDHDYQVLVTMDGDFTHSPSDIPTLISAARQCDLSIGSRWVKENSLPGWSVVRRVATMLGHALTKTVLRIPQDASGAFRAYRLDHLPRELFSLVRSRGYPFFFESLFIFIRNGYAVVEVPIILPARTRGQSKRSATVALKDAVYIFELYLGYLRRPDRYLLKR
jgi:dolichol-phosphate mannosyltransferase